VDRKDDGHSGLTLTGLRNRIEISGCDDVSVLGVMDRFREARKEILGVLGVLGKEGDWERVDGEFKLLGCEAQGQPGEVPHPEGLVELGKERVEIGSEGRSRGGRVGDNEGDKIAIVDLGRDRDGQCAVCIPEDVGSYVREASSYQGGLLVLRVGGTGSVESSFSRR